MRESVYAHMHTVKPFISNWKPIWNNQIPHKIGPTYCTEFESHLANLKAGSTNLKIKIKTCRYQHYPICEQTRKRHEGNHEKSVYKLWERQKKWSHQRLMSAIRKPLLFAFHYEMALVSLSYVSMIMTISFTNVSRNTIHSWKKKRFMYGRI